MSDSRRRHWQGRIGSQIMLTVLAALIVTGSAAQQADKYAECNKLLQLKKVVWSENAAYRYPFKLPTPDKERVWEHLGSNIAVAGRLERHLLLSKAELREKAAAMIPALTKRMPTVRLAFEDSRLRFTDIIIEAGGRVNREEFVDHVSSFIVFAPAQSNWALHQTKQ